MKPLDDSYKGARGQVEEAVALFQIARLLALITLVDRFVQCLSLDDCARILDVEEVVDHISGGEHFCGECAQSARFELRQAIVAETKNIHIVTEVVAAPKRYVFTVVTGYTTGSCEGLSASSGHWNAE